MADAQGVSGDRVGIRELLPCLEDLVLQSASWTLLIRFVWSDGKMKSGFREIILYVSVWVAVIVPWRGSL
jgi:hypothetical protein